MNDARRPTRYYVSKAFICAAVVLQLVHLFLNFREEMSLDLLLSGISLAVVVAFQIAFMEFAGIETRAVAIGYAISAVWTAVLRLFINAYRAPGGGIGTLFAGLSLPAYAAALFEALVFVVITLSFTDVIKGRKYLAAVAVAAKLAVFMAFAADAATGSNWAFMSGFLKGDSALIAYIRTGEYAGGQDIERFFEIVFTTLALLGYLVFFISFPGDQNREDPFGTVNTKVMVFVSAVSLGAAQICWIDRIILKINALTGARRRSALKETLCVVFIPLYFFYWLVNRGKIVREEGLKMGYPLPNRGAASVVLSIFTLGIAGSAFLQSDLNKITTDSHALTFEDEREPGDYARSEPFNEPPGFAPDDRDDSMFRPEYRQYADEEPREPPPAISPSSMFRPEHRQYADEEPREPSPAILPSSMFKPENRQYADEEPREQPPVILPPISMGYDDSVYSEPPTLQYPYVGLPIKQEPKVPPDLPGSVFSPDGIRIGNRLQELPVSTVIEDSKQETTAIPDGDLSQKPDEGMSITEASNRLEGLKSIMETIRELSELKNEGFITDDEFSRKKLELLSRL